MKAIVAHESGKDPILSWEDVPDVTHRPEEVLVDIKATAVNRADLLQAQGLYPPPPGESEIMGLEMCGEIAAVGDGTLAEPGRYVVLCLIPTGADPAEYLAAAATSDGPPQVDGGPPHIAHGMFAELVVTG